ncbi:hypothetical protein EMN47_08795 [Prolixibacteraceae bacterium JC049]|nr:hypothetical protein [Prolixibacteraceae bacterium JC049]
MKEKIMPLILFFLCITIAVLVGNEEPINNKVLVNQTNTVVFQKSVSIPGIYLSESVMKRITNHVENDFIQVPFIDNEHLKESNKALEIPGIVIPDYMKRKIKNQPNLLITQK